MTEPQLARSARVRRTIVAALAIGACAVGMVHWTESASLRSRSKGVATIPAGPDREKTWLPYRAPVVERPPVSTAEGAGLGDGEVVLGVEAGGRARAYRLEALRERTRHVVNDLVGCVPVSVTYCDITDCARAYTGPPGSGSLGLRLAGLLDGEMVVEIGGAEYLQESGEPRHAGAAPLPLDRLDPARSTWKEWKARHPDTDVYTGATSSPHAARPVSADTRPD